MRRFSEPPGTFKFEICIFLVFVRIFPTLKRFDFVWASRRRQWAVTRRPNWASGVGMKPLSLNSVQVLRASLHPVAAVCRRRPCSCFGSEPSFSDRGSERGACSPESQFYFPQSQARKAASDQSLCRLRVRQTPSHVSNSVRPTPSSRRAYPALSRQKTNRPKISSKSPPGPASAPTTPLLNLYDSVST